MVFVNSGKYNLDVSGIVGFFGGDESIAAMASVNLVRFRWALGWYNSPGSYFVAKKYGIIANNGFWDGIFPGKDSSPATTLGLDGSHGPRFVGSKSGTRIDMTGHLAYLLFSYCTDKLDIDEAGQGGNGYLYSLTIVPALGGAGQMPNIDLDRRTDPMTPYLSRIRVRRLLAAIITIGSSIAAAVAAAVKLKDIPCCISISVGIICNGVATLVYGSGTLKLQSPSTRVHSVDGDGILVRDNDIVVLRGPEYKIASITRGKYVLEYQCGAPYHLIGLASFALTFQAILQLILLPAATLHGQIVFLATFALSWFHNAYLASIDRERLQFEALRDKLGLNVQFQKVHFQRWASMVAATAFYLKPTNTNDWLRQLIPNDTPVWNTWRTRIVNAINSLNNAQPISFDLLDNEFPGDERSRQQLGDYLNDARVGYDELQELIG